MTELTALNVRITGDAGDLKAAVGVATGELGRVAQAAQAANSQSGALTRGFAGVASGAGKSAGVLRGMTQQLSQVGQQTMATGNFLQALAIQLPDIGLGFGAIGTAAGLLAGIALPMLASALTTSTEQTAAAAAAAERLKAAYDDVGTATIDAQTKIDKLKFGVDEEYQVELLKEQISIRGEITAKIAEGQRYLATTTDSIDRQRMVTEEMNAAIATLAGRHNEITGLLQQQQDRSAQLAIMEGVKAQRAGEVAAKQRDAAAQAERQKSAVVAAYQAYANTRTEANKLANETVRAGLAASGLSLVDFGNISAGAAAALTMAGNLGIAYNQAVALGGALKRLTAGDDERGSQRETVRGANTRHPNQPWLENYNRGGWIDTGGGGGGGGGGVGVNPLQGELEALQQSLLTQEQIEAESHMRRLETLKSALEQRLITQQEYAALMEQVEATHQAAMRSELNDGISGTLNALGQLFQGSKKIGAAVALANSWLAFTEVLKDPAYVGRPWARIAAAGQALAAGLNAVRNIKSAQPGGAGAGGGVGGSMGGAGGAGGAAAQSPVTTFQFTLTNDPFGFGENFARQFIDQLNATQRNGGQIRGVIA